MVLLSICAHRKIELYLDISGATSVAINSRCRVCGGIYLSQKEAAGEPVCARYVVLKSPKRPKQKNARLNTQCKLKWNSCSILFAIATVRVAYSAEGLKLQLLVGILRLVSVVFFVLVGRYVLIVMVAYEYWNTVDNLDTIILLLL